MKPIRLLLFTLLTVSFLSSCSAQAEKKEEAPAKVKSEGIELAYFHLTNRCVTCKAVESIASQTVAENYDGVVTFVSYNIEEPEGGKRGEELGIAGQALVLLAGDKKINLTSEGFMYARTNPEKFKEIIKENIDPILK